MRVTRSIYWTVLSGVLLFCCVTNLRADLVGLWRFDSDVSPQPDASGNGGDADPQDDVKWVDDVSRGGAMEFDGDLDHLLVEDSDPLSVEGPITIAAWANFATFDTWNGVVTKGGFDNLNYPAPYDVYTAQTGDGRVSFYAGGDAAIAQVLSEVSPELEEWQHIAITWDEEGEVIHYLNGEVNGVGFIDMEFTPPVDADQPLYIGSRQDFVTNMTGRLDDVAIFNEALSEEQVFTVMSGDFSAWGVGDGILGDFDNNGALEENDLNLLTVEINGGGANTSFDVNGDGTVNSADHQTWVKDLRKTWIGDSNLDNEFNTTDLVQVLSRGKYEGTTPDATWGDGDWNADLLFNSADLVAGLADGGYEAGPAPAAATRAIPEPASAGLLILGMVCLLTRRRTRF